MTDIVLTYKGKPITDLTKDELVNAMAWAFQEIEYQRERTDRYLQFASEPEGPTDKPMIPDRYCGDAKRIYREGFQDGYLYALKIVSTSPSLANLKPS